MQNKDEDSLGGDDDSERDPLVRRKKNEFEEGELS